MVLPTSRQFLKKNMPKPWRLDSPSDSFPDRDEYRITATRSGRMAGDPKPMGGARQMESTWNYNGSGKEAFGGADKWPALYLRMSFPVGRAKLRDELMVELAKFTDKWLANRGL